MTVSLHRPTDIGLTRDESAGRNAVPVRIAVDPGREAGEVLVIDAGGTAAAEVFGPAPAVRA